MDQLENLNNQIELAKSAIKVQKNLLGLGYITQEMYKSKVSIIGTKIRLLKEKYRRVVNDGQTETNRTVE